ncbi:MAG: response regulator [Rhodoferax sp.]|nr:response regulator [Rhodoferax sp.]MCF8208596.1 response regulator [Rhodoferax sp.]
MQRPSVLIIDDQMQSVALLLKYFWGQTIEVMVALDGQDGLNKALIGQPDIILLDIQMPLMNGYEVCRKLKSDYKTAQTPVIFLSANTSVQHKLEGFAAGAVDYICKPFSSEEVLARVYVHFKTSHSLAAVDLSATAIPATRPDPAKSRESQLIASAIAFLHASSEEWQGTEFLAHKLGVNEKKLTELFRKHFGMTVSEYLINLRLEGARARLTDSQTQVQIIAKDAGYFNASDFSRAFRNRYGLGPRQYRKVCQSDATSASVHFKELDNDQ